jgi:hypothetical protein
MLHVKRLYEDPEQLKMHLRMTHCQYVGDIRAIRKSKAGPGVTIKAQLSEMHQTLHADMRKGHHAHGSIDHIHDR